MSIALKEAREANYWLRLMKYSEIFPADRMLEIIDESEQIMKIIAQIIITTKKNLAIRTKR